MTKNVFLYLNRNLKEKNKLCQFLDFIIAIL